MGTRKRRQRKDDDEKVLYIQMCVCVCVCVAMGGAEEMSHHYDDHRKPLWIIRNVYDAIGRNIACMGEDKWM